MDVSRELSSMDAALAGIEAMEAYFRSVNMPVSVSDMGIRLTDAQIEELSEKCSIADSITIGVVKRLKKSDMIKIYQMAK